MQGDFDQVKETIVEAAKSSDIGDRLDDIAVEEDRDEEGDAFIRVTIRMTPNVEIDDSQLERVLERIENSIVDLDERYASVRFLDAA